jgi:predicted small lipoprotein YifL
MRIMVIGLRCLIWVGLVLSITACGQKGDLYFPADQQTEKKKKVLLDQPSDVRLASSNLDDARRWERTPLTAPAAQRIRDLRGGDHAG